MADEPLNAAARALTDGWGLSAAISPLGEGHINDTLLVTMDHRPRFVLQRINRSVFREPGRVMANLSRVLDHLRDHGADLTAPLMPTTSGASAFIDHAGEWWRLWGYVPGGRSLSRTSDPSTCRAAGQAFGRFQRLLADLPLPELEPTIAGFLELDGYLAAFDAAASMPEAESVVGEVCGAAFIDAHRELAGRFPRQHDVIHGDCKLNNLLFAERSPQVLAVLDLDTVMVGHWAWDLGDLSRSVLLGTRTEEETRSALLALTDGFALGSGRTVDLPTVVDATVYVAFMLGIRFLTDHLEGDRYFRVARHGANLDRSREQFDLVRRLTTLGERLASPADDG